MIPADKPNPFRILGLPTTASSAEVVERGQELTQVAETDEERLLCRWAMEELIRRPEQRALYELFEVPGAHYDEDEWDDFVRKHRRNPVDLAALAPEVRPPSPADLDFPVLLDVLVRALVEEPPPADPRPALAGSPYPPEPGGPALEVADVLFG